MFDALAQRLDRISTSLKSRGRISERDLDEALAEIRAALLDADVELSVVGGVPRRRPSRCELEALSKSLTPGQQVVKAVNDELVAVLGGEPLKVTYASRPPTVVLLAGLQGAGKTTAAAKLATLVQVPGALAAARRGRPPAPRGRRAAARPRRPGGRAGVLAGDRPRRRRGRAASRRPRASAATCASSTPPADSSIDEALMDEVRTISSRTSPHYTFLVIDAMTGQDAVADRDGASTTRSALDGVIVTKLDGDARGGVALSVRTVVGKPDRLRLGRRAAGGPRPLLPRPHGEPDPRHGRRALA